MGIRIFLLVTSLMPFSIGHANGHPPGEADLAGWAYLEDGDFPLQLAVRHDSKGPIAYLSLPAQKLCGQIVLDFQWNKEGISFKRKNSEGKIWNYSAKQEPDVFRGRATLEGSGDSFEFLLHKSDEAITGRRLDKHENYVGTYDDGKGRSILISNWSWGELRLVDPRSGRTGTLFESPNGDFFLGSAEYVPAPIFARIRFQRDATGSVIGMKWTPSSGDAPRDLARTKLIEEPFEFSNSNVKLSGTLIKPPTPGPHPAIVVLGGSGWKDRAGTKADGEWFVSHGVAAFVYDQRGFGKSQGGQICSFETTASDALAAVKALRSRDDILADKVGLSGRSRGGWIAPLAASRGDVSFLVLFVPPAVSPASQETTRRLNLMRSEGVDAKDLEPAAHYLDLQMKSVLTDSDWQQYVAVRDNVAAKPWFDIAEQFESRESSDFQWCKLNMHHDPIPALEKIRCPVLALFGERDDNVTVEPNLKLMQGALDRAGNKTARLIVVPNGDHGLRPVSRLGEMIELHRTTGTVPGIWENVQDFLLENNIVKR